MRTRIAALLALLFVIPLGGCDKMVDRAHASASLTQRAFSDAADAWSDILTYHPPAQPQAPQTRYCYKMMTDIVCYDSVQPGLTAKLVGYQDGDHASWIQPGGGSLGASGGEPKALRVASKGHGTEVIGVSSPVENSPVVSENANARMGEIQSVTLPPRK